MNQTASTNPLEALRSHLSASNPKTQLSLIDKIASMGDEGLVSLEEFMRSQLDTPPNPVLGKVYQTLARSESHRARVFINSTFPQGLVPLPSDRAIDYQPLQQALIQQEYQEADRLTISKLCELAGAAAQERKWLYFTEVEKFPSTDLKTIDNLWLIYSEGQFGFSVQREIWRSLGQDFSKLWDKIGWKKDNNWTRYPGGFTWNLSAPRGHLPLSNQIRGVRAFSSLLNHPTWS